MNIFKSRTSIELERLSSSIDTKNNVFGLSLKTHHDRLMLIRDLIQHEAKLCETVKILKKKNINVVFNETTLEEYFIGGLTIKTADFTDEIKALSSSMDVITKKRVRLATICLAVTGLSMVFGFFNIATDHVLVLSSWAGFFVLLLGNWFLRTPERKITSDAISIRVKVLKEANRMRAVIAELEKSNAFIADRVSDIKSSVETITQLTNGNQNSKLLQEEFIVVNAIVSQILYHLDKDRRE